MKHSLAQFSKSEVYFSIVYEKVSLTTYSFYHAHKSLLSILSPISFWFIVFHLFLFLCTSTSHDFSISIMYFSVINWNFAVRKNFFFLPPFFIQLFIYINVDLVIYSVVISPQKTYTEFYMHNPCKFLRFPFAFYLNDSIL